MKDTQNLNKSFQMKINSKFQKNILADISIDKQSKKSKNQKSQKRIIKEREKEKIERKMKEIFEDNTSFNKENAQSKDLLMNNILKNEKFLVNKEIKLQKTDQKNNASETELKRLKKKRVYYTILVSEKNEIIQNFYSNFVKKNIKCCGTDDKILKILEKYQTESEKNEISKTCESSTNKIMIRNTSEKFYEYSKERKNKEQKNEENYKSKEVNSPKKGNNKHNKRKNDKINKKERYENESNINLEDEKKEKNKEKLNLLKNKEKIQINNKEIIEGK